jgi:hypothetical protein
LKTQRERDREGERGRERACHACMAGFTASRTCFCSINVVWMFCAVSAIKRERERERETERETETERKKERKRERERQRSTHTAPHPRALENVFVGHCKELLVALRGDGKALP